MGLKVYEQEPKPTVLHLNPLSAEFFLYKPYRTKVVSQFEIIINILVIYFFQLYSDSETYVISTRPLSFINSFSARIDFRHPNLTSIDVRFSIMGSLHEVAWSASDRQATNFEFPKYHYYTDTLSQLL